MTESAYHPVSHDHHAFLAKAMGREGFAAAYAESAEEHELMRQLLARGEVEIEVGEEHGLDEVLAEADRLLGGS